MSAIVETDWGQIYTDYYDKIFGYIKRRVRYIDLCEELTHDVFIKAITADEKGIGSDSHFSGWIHRIAHNLVIDHYRIRDKMNEEPIEHAYGVHDECSNPLDDVLIGEVNADLYAALRKLTDEQQKVIEMRFLDDYDFDEIAHALDKNRDAIKALQFRALTNVNKLLGGTGRPSREQGKSKEVKKILREHGPLKASDIAKIANLPLPKINSALYSRNSAFCKVDVEHNGRVAAYVWGIIGIHDKEAA